jgi:hypothetical protein
VIWNKKVNLFIVIYTYCLFRETSSGTSFIQFKEETQLDSQSTLQDVKAVVPKMSAGDSQIFSGENLSDSSEECKSNKALVPANQMVRPTNASLMPIGADCTF